MTKTLPDDAESGSPEAHTSPDLPVYAHKREIAAAIRANPVVVICGETGSGKTTQIPKICLEIGRGTNGLIGCTQPRRVAAVTVAERVAEELTPNGNLVGWQHRFSRQTSPQNKIKFMTDGILLAEIRNDPLLRRYDTIMVDEAHERTLNIDFILGCLRRILPQRPDLKVIVSSATLETSRFSEFFSDAPVINIPGRAYPVEVRYRDPGEDADLALAVADAVDEALHDENPGDILVFLPGERDIRAAAEVILGRQIPQTAVIPLMASLPGAEQKRAFQMIRGVHRIILSTNVAETSVTIPGIRTVIDSGLARISRYDPRARIKRLQIEAVSQASAEQRKGRCGRIGPGVCIRLYAEDDLQKRSPYTDPEIRRTSLAGLILSMFDWKLGDLADFPFLQPPPGAMIREGYKELIELGAIRENPPYPDGAPPRFRYNVTPLGRRIVQLPLDPRLARMLLAAESNNAMRDALIVVSGLSCEDPLVRPADKLEEANRQHAKFKTERSDFAGMLLLWRFFHDTTATRSRGALRRLCAQHFVAYRKLCEWEDVRNQLERQLKAMSVPIDSTTDSDDGLHQALLTGLLTNIGEWDPETRDYRGANGVRFSIFPGSGLYKKPPQWIICAERVDTSRLFARRVAAIDPKWIEPAARHVCKYHYHSEYWDERYGTARALQRVTLYGLLISDGIRRDISRFNPEFARNMFIREGLIEGRFPKPVPKFVVENLQTLGKRLAATHKTRTADPEGDKQTFFDLYDKRLAPTCVNVTSLRAWLSKAPKHTSDTLVFSDTDFSTPADSAAGFPDHVEIAERRFPLRYRHSPGAEDDGITCTLKMQEIPLLRFWHSDWLVPGALHEKVVYLLNGLTRATHTEIANGFGKGIKGRDVNALADACISTMERQMPLAHALSRTIMRHAGLAIEPEIWNEATMPPAFTIRWRIIDSDRKEVFVSRDKAEIISFHAELMAIAPEIAKENSDFLFGKERLQETAHIQSVVFPDLPETLIIGQAGASIHVFPALTDEEKTVGIRFYNTPEVANAAHEHGIMRLIALTEGLSPNRGQARSQQSNKKKAPVRRLSGFNALPPASTISSARGTDSLLPPQPALPRDLLTGTLRATFINGTEPLPRTATDLASLIAARRNHYGTIHRELGQCVDAALTLAEDSLHRLDHALKLPNTSAEDIAGQIGWLIFPGFVAATPLQRIREFPRYLNAILLRIERGNLDPAKEARKHEDVQPYWQRYTALMESLDKQLPYNVAALEAYRWLVEEFRVSVWAQELRTPVPVSPQRLDKAWDEVFRL